MCSCIMKELKTRPLGNPTSLSRVSRHTHLPQLLTMMKVDKSAPGRNNLLNNSEETKGTKFHEPFHPFHEASPYEEILKKQPVTIEFDSKKDVLRGGSTSNMVDNHENKQVPLSAAFNNWHCRLGHLSPGKSHMMACIGLLHTGGLTSARRPHYILVACLVRPHSIHGGPMLQQVVSTQNCYSTWKMCIG